MIYLGFNNLFKNWKQAIITAMEMAVIMLLVVITVSIYNKQSKTYDVFSDLITGKGVEIFSGDTLEFYVTDDGTYNMSDFLSYLKDVDKCVFSLNKQLYIDGEDTCITIGLDDVMKSYEPEMLEGRWLGDGDEIEAVITENDLGINVGDVIDLVDYNDDVFAGMLEVKICGIIKNGSYVYKGESMTSPESVDTMFTVHDAKNSSVDAQMPYLYMSKSLLESSFDRVSVCNSVLIKYNDDISAENLKSNDEFISSICSFNEFEDINENSLSAIKKKMETIIPLAVCVFLLVSITMIITSVISTYEEKEMYAVCFVCGMKWSGIFFIKLIESIINVMMGLCVFFIINNVVFATKLNKLFEIKFYVSEVYIICGLLIFLILIRTFSAYISIRKNSCSDLIRKAKL